MSTVITTLDGGLRNRGGRTVFRTASAVYVVVRTAGATLAIWKATDPLTSFARQDSAGEPASTGQPFIAADIDSNGLIGVVYWSNDTTLSYVPFDTATDTWGSPETVATVTTSGTRGLAFAFDSNNKPHCCWIDETSSDLFYANKVGASWTTAQPGVITLHTYGRWPDLIINSNNIPVVAYLPYADPNNGYIMACLGDANNPTTFTQTAVSNAGTNPRYRMPSMAQCANGDIVIARANNATDIDPRPLTLLRHLAADNWATWQVEETINANNENQQPSIAVNGNNIYIFCEKTSADAGIWYWTNATGSWVSAQVVTAASQYSPIVRWGMRNNPSYNSNLMDFVWFNDTDNEQYWDALDLTVEAPQALFFPRRW